MLAFIGLLIYSLVGIALLFPLYVDSKNEKERKKQLEIENKKTIERIKKMLENGNH